MLDWLLPGSSLLMRASGIYEVGGLVGIHEVLRIIMLGRLQPETLI